MDRCQFFDQFARCFDRKRITELARQTRWLVRQGKIEAFEFVVGLVFGQMSALGLTLSAHASSFSEPVHRTAVHQRYSERTVEFFHETFNYCLREALAESQQPSQTQALAAHFKAIHLVDSSSFDCPESLANIYPGCGGAASKANCKLLLRYEYLRGQFVPLGLVAGKQSDLSLAHQLPSIVNAGELLLTDKGFLTKKALKAIDEKQGYYLLPLARSFSLSLAQSEGTRTPLNLADALRHSDQTMVQWPEVWLGAGTDALPVRLVAFQLSPESAARHRAALRESQRKQGREPSADALELAGWMVLITNAPADKLPAKAMSYLYRVRWQIELVFKQCKSVLRLHLTKARKNNHRIRSEIWARLIAAVVLFAWHAHLQTACWLEKKREISFAQVAAQLQQHGMILARALIAGGQCLAEELWRFWRHLLRTTIKGRQRTRQTTWEALNEHWPELSGNSTADI